MLILACTLALPLAAVAATAGSGIESVVQGSTVNDSPRIHGTDATFNVTVEAFVDSDDWGNTAVFVDNVFYDCIDTPDHAANTGAQMETFDVTIAAPLDVPGTYTIGFSAATAANTLCAVPTTPQDNATPDLVIASQSTVTVSKTFSDSNTAVVNVNLVCTSGVITPDANEDAGNGGDAVFTITGFDDGATCTATETTNLTGYTVDESACLNVALVSDADAPCTITNTQIPVIATISKNFSDNNTASVAMAMTCDSGATITPINANATQAAPATFEISNFEFDGSELCSATETVPVGYTANEGSCTNSMSVTLGSSGTGCTIFNQQDSVTIIVGKTYDDGNTIPADILLECDSGTIAPSATLPASPAASAEFILSNFDFTGATCVATEPTPPTGYTADVTDCAVIDVALGDGIPEGDNCVVANEQAPVTIEVFKVFSDNNPMPVPMQVSCSAGATVEVVRGSAQDLPIAEPAVFKITDLAVDGSTLCTATETTVPTGYTADQTACVDLAMTLGVGNVECTIANAQDPVEVVVAKDFSDDNAADVIFALACTDGTVTGTGTASEATPATFTVSDFPFGGTSCVATEPTVPDGYTVDETGCEAVAVAVGQDPGAPNCTILNELGVTANFLVTKTYSDNNPDEVQVTLTCTSGLPLVQTFDISDGNPVNFVLTNVDEAVTNCTVTETGHADGYTAFFVAGGDTAGSTGGADGCTFPNVAPGDMNTCEIRNAADDATFTVHKVWDIFNDGAGDEVIEQAYVTIWCDAEITNGYYDDYFYNWYISGYLGDGGSLIAKVDTTFGDATCWADEDVGDQSGVESSGNCYPRSISAGGSSECTFTNTVFFEGIPTLSQYGLALMALLMLGMGMVGFRRFV